MAEIGPRANGRLVSTVLSPMKTLRARFVLLMAVPALVAGAFDRQVDPDWLRQWQLAQTHRPAEIGPVGRIVGPDEPGAALIVDGQVFQPDGSTPADGVIVFAYHTDADGVYSSPERPGTPWRLQGWARTDENGGFEFRTIRPAPYPGRSVPAHIHLTVESERYGRQWVDSLVFADDPLIAEDERARSSAAGRFAHVRPVRMDGTVGHVEFAIRLKPSPDF